ncbi:MAG: phytanoyl-CoA dioxygenase family protein [Verrucomicrobiales bacterium]|nr:phytanoyl-CoA dioxygenase family protein [Verrucomicrobiales bacterium]
MSGVFSEEQKGAYHRDGYVFARGLFSREEIGLLGEAAHADRALDDAATALDDGEGNRVRLSLWNHPGDGIYGMFARCRRVVDSVEQLIGGEVYHYHSKMVLKDARTGGAWAWHQDYGYWYQNGLLFPDLCSVMIAVDGATQENGCLQLLERSHHMGRVNHILSGEQAGADRERVEEAKKRLELVYAEMEAGDAVFFHSNTLHASGPNHSENSRWAMICCYNAASNDPYKESHHPGYTPLSKVDDEEVIRVGKSGVDRVSVQFANIEQEDRSAKDLAGEAES